MFVYTCVCVRASSTVLTDSFKPSNLNCASFLRVIFNSCPWATRIHCADIMSETVNWSTFPVLLDLNMAPPLCNFKRPPF